jgi:N-acetylmuramoyl-L-alanine amidase
LFALLVGVALPGEAAVVAVNHLRVWQAPDHTRLVFDVGGALEHRVFTLTNPDRIVIDMDNARLQGRLPVVDTGGPMLAGLRAGDRGTQGLRIVLDLKRAAVPRSFVLKPYGQYGHRLVVDLHDAVVAEAVPSTAPMLTPTNPVPTPVLQRPQELIVAIDAGHGGEDPGAIGRRYRTREKDVVLAIARELRKLVAAAPGMRPVMIRDGDYYIGLRERIKKAHRHQVDVFVSIHADAVGNRHARGSSVYALSERGATNEAAKVLADKENAADYVGGTDIDDKDDLLMKVLVDMTQTATISDSLSLGGDILDALRTIGPLHSSNVGQAGFMVLKLPHIPSVLVETAFISNPEEERKLRDRAQQRRIAQGIFAGLKRAEERLRARRAPVAPALQQAAAAAASAGATETRGAREHVVQPGETLAAIARHYDIHVDALRFLNNLGDSDLSVGLRLLIPARDGKI